MILLSCLLAFCLLPPISSKAGEVTVQHSPVGSEGINSHKKDQIAHGNDETDTDLNVIKHFVDDLVMIAPVMFPSGKTVDLRFISSVLFGDDQPQIGQSKGITKTGINEMPTWAMELAKTKEAIENDADGKSWADLLHKLQQIIYDTMSTLDGDVDEQNAKIRMLQNKLKETAEELAELSQIPKNEIEHPLENEWKIEQIVKELANFLNKLKVQFEKKEQKSNEENENREQTKRMLNLIMHFPIDAVDGMTKLNGRKKHEGRRRRRRMSIKLILGIVAVVVCAVIIVVGFKYVAHKQRMKANATVPRNVELPQQQQQQQQQQHQTDEEQQ